MSASFGSEELRRQMPDGTAGSSHWNIQQLEQDHGLKWVVEKLLRQEDSVAVVNLNSLCYERPYELVKVGTFPILVEELSSNKQHVKDRATACLAMLVAVDTGVRNDFLRDARALAALKHNIESSNKSASFCLSCLHLMIGLITQNPVPPITVVKEWEPFLVSLIVHVTPEEPHMEVIVQATLAMSHYSNYPGVLFNKVVVERLVTFLGMSESRLWNPALLTLGNVVSRSTQLAQVALEAGILQHSKALVQNTLVQENTCFLLAKLASGKPEQVQMLFEPFFMPTFKHVAEVVCGNYCLNSRLHALALIVAVLSNCRESHIVRMDELHCVAAVCSALHFTTDAQILIPVLESLTRIIDVYGSIHLNYGQRIEWHGVAEKLGELKGHSNSYVANMSNCVLAKYLACTENGDTFDPDEDVLQENMVALNRITQCKAMHQVHLDEGTTAATFGSVNTRSANA